MIPRARPNYGFTDLLCAAPLSRGEGSSTARVEAQVRDILGLPFVLLTASGRGALYLVLRASARQEVVIPSYTCSAVAEAAQLAGKTIVYAEHSRPDFNQTVEDLRRHLRSGRIYVATHQYGLTAPIRDLLKACKASDVEIIEDVAPALGARVGTTPVGRFGRACFGSFDTTKLINAPLKGGFVATADAELFERVKQVAETTLKPMSVARKMSCLLQAAVLVAIRHPLTYRLFHLLNFGATGRVTAETGRLDEVPNAFYTSRFADWQAHIVAPQLADIDALIARRRRAYELLRRELATVGLIDTPPEDTEHQWAPIRFPVLARTDKMDVYRAAVRHGIDFGFSFTQISAPSGHTVAWSIAKRVLNVPFDNHLSDREIQTIAHVFRQLDRHA